MPSYANVVQMVRCFVEDVIHIFFSRFSSVWISFMFITYLIYQFRWPINRFVFVECLIVYKYSRLSSIKFHLFYVLFFFSLRSTFFFYVYPNKWRGAIQVKIKHSAHSTMRNIETKIIIIIMANPEQYDYSPISVWVKKKKCRRDEVKRKKINIKILWS